MPPCEIIQGMSNMVDVLYAYACVYSKPALGSLNPREVLEYVAEERYVWTVPCSFALLSVFRVHSEKLTK